ncbi:biotin/lipoyl-binding protein [Xanthobacter sp. DSM 24535]|uniref:biotin/lipoyl-binding protein n=1 Tax=Roseixanthobacter psychrophilus TaxID=3119917 RepID=UPI003729B0D9
MSSSPRILAWSALLGSTLVLSACGDPAPAEQAGPPPRPVQVMTVALRPVEADKTFVGIVRPRWEIDLSFRVAGKVQQRLVEVGQRVKTGDVIAKLDPEDFKLELGSAEAELAAAQANLAQTTAGTGAIVRFPRAGLLPPPIWTVSRWRRMRRWAAWSGPSARSILPATS